MVGPSGWPLVGPGTLSPGAPGLRRLGAGLAGAAGSPPRAPALARATRRVGRLRGGRLPRAPSLRLDRQDGRAERWAAGRSGTSLARSARFAPAGRGLGRSGGLARRRAVHRGRAEFVLLLARTRRR